MMIAHMALEDVTVIIIRVGLPIRVTYIPPCVRFIAKPAAKGLLSGVCSGTSGQLRGVMRQGSRTRTKMSVQVLGSQKCSPTTRAVQPTTRLGGHELGRDAAGVTELSTHLPTDSRYHGAAEEKRTGSASDQAPPSGERHLRTVLAR